VYNLQQNYYCYLGSYQGLSCYCQDSALSHWAKRTEGVVMFAA
jgi:hypothetical protein